MISNFRKQKLLHVFNIFFDTDSSGCIEKIDFELAAENIARLRGWKLGDTKYKNTLESLLKIWESLQNEADANRDEKVTAEEWVAMWEAYAENQTAVFEWQKLYCKLMFELEDDGEDGAIDSEEFSSVYQSFGLLKDDAIAAFKLMSKGETYVTWEDFQVLWNQYFTSDDPSEPGNYIFGAATF